MIASKDDPANLPATYFPGVEDDQNKDSPCAIIHHMQQRSPWSLVELMDRETLWCASTSNSFVSTAYGKAQ
jgi:hypothetical protein